MLFDLGFSGEPVFEFVACSEAAPLSAKIGGLCNQRVALLGRGSCRLTETQGVEVARFWACGGPW